MKSITQAIRDVREQYEEAMKASLAAQEKASSLAEALELMDSLPALVNGTGKIQRKAKPKAKSVAKEVATPMSHKRPWLDVYRQLFSKSTEQTVGEVVTAAQNKNNSPRSQAYQGLLYLIKVAKVSRNGDKVTWAE